MSCRRAAKALAVSEPIAIFVILSGDLYRVVVAAPLLQLYQNRRRLLERVDRGSPLGHRLGHPAKA